ncbi:MULTISPECIES: AGE family epimerase/isomerase [unclassified Rhodococcus (in: high G+C Gram-positive bacteria)]|uniref:AGE family epimerase/isomerase n=1 Tax=unclassified Rhodococcus (in: high G+C Gram-positive bacteria) TaxID=192944 RepID=UPI001C9AEF79|nr:MULTISPECIES: AGE family epimerase/isomerase [unclassified Rhodococcus (in: high G+C Gram-positive bacteria)]
MSSNEMPAGPSWPTLPSHRSWLDGESARLLDFGRTLDHPSGGAAWLDGTGEPDLTRPVFTWITARMVHVQYLGALLGHPGSRRRADRLFDGLLTVLRDDRHDGWVESTDDATKSAYTHAFVVLAASTATAAGHPRGPALLAEALAVVDARFWDDRSGMCVDTWNADWSELSDYRGINANMHMVEAMLAAVDAGAPTAWRERAARICDTVIEWSEANDWRIPEHFTTDWEPLLEYNSDSPADQFKPYGATVGHGFEWSRLMLQVSLVATSARGHDHVDVARSLYRRAAADGWQEGSTPGFVYTTDWTGRPVVTQRLHWVLCEAIAAAATLLRWTGEGEYENDYRAWWDHAADCYIDRAHGSWHHELDEHNTVATSVWGGKPDVYHAAQAVWISRYPTGSSLAAVLSGGMLDPR